MGFFLSRAGLLGATGVPDSLVTAGFTGAGGVAFDLLLSMISGSTRLQTFGFKNFLFRVITIPLVSLIRYALFPRNSSTFPIKFQRFVT